MTKVLIVGGGITGAVASSLIRSYLPATCSIAVWEKNTVIGGRLRTIRHGNDSVDLGAQYISPTPQEYQDHHSFYEELEQCGLLNPLTCRVIGERDHAPGTRHFTAPDGMASLVKHYLSKSGAQVKLDTGVSGLLCESDGFMVSRSDNSAEKFDAVILTMPVPQLSEISGDLSSLIDQKPDVKQNLSQVEYSCRYALGLYMDTDITPEINWSVKYFDDPIIRYVAIDGERRNIANEAARRRTVVVHTTVPFGLESINNQKESVCSNVLPRLHMLLPELPKPSFVKMYRWRYSQVYKPYNGTPGALVLQTRPLLVLGGDSFTYSKFNGCLTSALKISEIVQQYLQTV